MTTSRTSLPEYAHPPLVAATLGVLFDRQFLWEKPLLADFRQRLGPEWLSEWTSISASDTDPRTDLGRTASGGFHLKNLLEDRELQIGRGHFSFTWLGADDGRYPRYENVRDGFVAAWDAWCASSTLPADSVAKWIVSYVNRIPQGAVWQHPADWSFCKLMPATAGLLESITSGHWTMLCPGIADGLVAAWTLEAAPDGTTPPCVWFRLTAQGDADLEAGNLLDGMDSGRAAIVQTFSELMSPAANAYWGLRRREK